MQPPDTDNFPNRSSLEWLVDLAPRLNVAVEVTDANAVPIAPLGPTLDAAAIRRMLTSHEPSLRSAMADARRARAPVAVAVERVQAMCFGLASGGVLLLARKLAPGDSIEECRQDLESIGAWLRGAIDATLAQPDAIAVEPYRIVSFRRILREATSRGSIRKVMGAFVEALSVWDDVLVRAYVQSVTGGFLLHASSMGALPTAPYQLDESVVPGVGRMRRLSRAEVESLGLPSDAGDTLVHSIRIGHATAWALVFSGMIDDREEVRLRVCSDILRESMDDILTATMNRVVAEVGRPPQAQEESLETAVQTVLGQLTAAIGGRQAALAVAAADGRQSFASGSVDLLERSDETHPNRLIVRSSDASGVMTIAVDRDQPFAVFEREILEAGVAVVHSWVQAALQRATDIERRRRSQPVDTLFDQLATEAIAAGQQTTVIVMAVDSAMLRPGLLPTWIGRIRGHIRGDDRAGILSDREIAVLLRGVSADQAALVSSRLQRLVDPDEGAGALVHPAIGMTTRAPDEPFEGSLVGAARRSAAAHR